MKRCLIFLTTILACISVAGAQDIVTGRVVDKKGNPLPGAKVSIKHTPEINDTAIVDNNGNFSITWSNPYEKKMIVTYPGMNTRKVNVDKSGMNIKMSKTTWWNKKPEHPELYAGLQMGFPTYGSAHPAMGVMAAYFKVVGVYAKFMRNLDYAKEPENYEGGYASSYDNYYTGKTKLQYMSGSLGLAIRLKSPIYLLVGGAIGKRNLYWQGANGEYFQKEDGNVKFTPELGVMFKYKHYAINAGMGFGFNFGLGYVF